MPARAEGRVSSRHFAFSPYRDRRKRPATPATGAENVARIAGVNLPTNKRVVIALQYIDRKSTRLNSSHQIISYAVFCLKKKKKITKKKRSTNANKTIAE